jgi:hypothetical protein
MKSQHLPKKLPKSLLKQAALRRVKTPIVLAQQAVLNSVMLGRKGGLHMVQGNKRIRLNAVSMQEDLASLYNSN